MSLLTDIMLIVLLILLVFASIGGISMLLGGVFDAPYVPSSRKTTKKMIEVSGLQPGEVVFDLGCGDGRIVFAADKQGAGKCIGVEISPFFVSYSRFRKMLLGAKRTEIRYGNIFAQPDLPDADIIFFYLLPKPIQRFFDIFWHQLKPGTRIVSHGFAPNNITPDQTYEKSQAHSKIYVFVKK